MRIADCAAPVRRLRRPAGPSISRQADFVVRKALTRDQLATSRASDLLCMRARLRLSRRVTCDSARVCLHVLYLYLLAYAPATVCLSTETVSYGRT